MSSGIILGIESSCDETSVAVVEKGRKILSNVIYSQIEEHAPFGGVVPELASRAHLEKINSIYAEALKQACVTIEEIDAIAVTTHPGLTGSLMIGANFAKSLSVVSGLKVISINHLEAHLYAVGLEGYQFTYPFLGLLLSGGNSAIYKVQAPNDLIQIADTMDDACGEAFDKAASLLGFGYPGGPRVEIAARQYALDHNLEHRYNENTSMFTRLLKNMPRTQLAFSFSGIKTAVRNAARSESNIVTGKNAVGGISVGKDVVGEIDVGKIDVGKIDVGNIAYDFQNTVFELVVRNMERAVDITGIKTIVASGGVLSNGVLRENLDSLAKKRKLKITYPKNKILCTDNAAMVAAIGYHYWQKGLFLETTGFDVSSKSCLPSA